MDIIKEIQESNRAFVRNDNFKGVKKVIVDKAYKPLTEARFL